MITKLLVANRGEIACRIMATARRMGIATVAVYGEADRGAPHVHIADEAVAIGPALAEQSYLNIKAILEAATRTGADAIHPGYGFLSENAEFARACGDAGITFVGPSPDAIRVMGDKAAAKAKMIEAGVPVVAGYQAQDQSDERLAREAERIGYPLLIKAAAGGGGRGMRPVAGPGDFGEALASARREAMAAFGDDAVLLERLVANARHVEVQIFGDRHGNVVHLFERDCSTQRRHQKIIEESPSPIVDEALRASLGQWAVAAAASVGYEGAGTVEFIVDQAGSAFFLEMNTRLQVEHPVTEMVTGIDLVEWQLRVAAGEGLPLEQNGIRLDGHAVEARLYAEDPYRGFLPQTGKVVRFRPGASPADKGLRIDAGIAEGDDVTAHYDPMIAKFIAHGADRDEAIARLDRLIGDTTLAGIASNAGFLVRLLRSQEMRAGSMTVATVDRWIANNAAIVEAPRAAAHDFMIAGSIAALAPGGDWFRSTGIADCPVTLECGGRTETVRLCFERGRLVSAAACGQSMQFDDVRWDGEALIVAAGGHKQCHRALAQPDRYHLFNGSEALVFSEPDPLGAAVAEDDPGRLLSPAAGRVSRIAIAPGQKVEAGQMLAVIEAMKMETTLSSRVAGEVMAIHTAEGEQVQAGELLVEIDAAKE